MKKQITPISLQVTDIYPSLYEHIKTITTPNSTTTYSPQRSKVLEHKKKKLKASDGANLIS